MQKKQISFFKKAGDEKKVYPTTFFEEAYESISLNNERAKLLTDIAHTIANEYEAEGIVNLNFICTHNSRRSQIAQVWTFFAVDYFNLKNIHSFSGGTEVTSFHRNTVKTLQQVGFEFSVVDFSHQNPRYLISYKGSNKSLLGFSKLYDNEENKAPYFTITTCSSAYEKCPHISSAKQQFHLPYVDLIISDGSKFQKEIYLEINKQIAGEIFIIFQKVNNILLNK